MGTEASGQQGGRWSYKETAWLTEGHRQPIYCGAFNHFSPQLGNLLATVGGNRATVYNCRPGGEMEVLQVYCDADAGEEYYACAWSLDAAAASPLLLLAGKTGRVAVVSAGAGVLQGCLEGHGSAVNDVAVHPTRPHLVATASRDHSLRLWNLRSRCCVLVFQGDGGHRNEVLTLSWKPGPRDLLLSAGMDNFIKVWCLDQHRHTLDASDEWKPGARRAFRAGHVTTPAFSTERVHWNYVDCVRWLGDHVLSKSVDNRVLLWRPDTAPPHAGRGGEVELIQELQLEDCASVWWLRFSLDHWCTLLAVGTNTGRVLLFDPHAQQAHPRARLKPRRAAPLVRQTAVSYDGGIVVACHEDGSLTRYDRVDAASMQRPDSRAEASRATSAQGGSGSGSQYTDSD